MNENRESPIRYLPGANAYPVSRTNRVPMPPPRPDDGKSRKPRNTSWIPLATTLGIHAVLLIIGFFVVREVSLPFDIPDATPLPRPLYTTPDVNVLNAQPVMPTLAESLDFHTKDTQSSSPFAPLFDDSPLLEKSIQEVFVDSAVIPMFASPIIPPAIPPVADKIEPQNSAPSPAIAMAPRGKASSPKSARESSASKSANLAPMPPPSIVSAPAPSYPKDARKSGHAGVVGVRVVVNPDGSVRDTSLHRTSGHQSLDNSAVTAVREWKFTPNLNKNAKPATVVVTVTFKL